MALSGAVNVIGGLFEAPESIGRASLESKVNLCDFVDFAKVLEGRVNIANPVTPYVMKISPITAVRAVAIRLRTGTAIVLVTSSVGADKAFPLSKLWVWRSTVAGSEITALKLLGTADVEYVVAGD